MKSIDLFVANTFNNFDLNKDGSIDKSEMMHICNSILELQVKIQAKDERMVTADRGYQVKKLKPEMIPALTNSLWNAADSNKDNKITIDEFSSALKTLFVSPGFVTVPEAKFIEILNVVTKDQVVERFLRDAFTKFDVDKNGVFDITELRPFLLVVAIAQGKLTSQRKDGNHKKVDVKCMETVVMNLEQKDNAFKAALSTMEDAVLNDTHHANRGKFTYDEFVITFRVVLEQSFLDFDTEEVIECLNDIRALKQF